MATRANLARVSSARASRSCILSPVLSLVERVLGGVGPGVPNIGHRAGEQRPGLAPISPVVIDYFADRHRMLGSRRRVVRIRQPCGPLGQQILQLKVAEPGKRQIKAAELQLAEFEAQQLRIPPRRPRRYRGCAPTPPQLARRRNALGLWRGTIAPLRS